MHACACVYTTKGDRESESKRERIREREIEREREEEGREMWEKRNEG